MREKFAQFMTGRNGNDSLNMFLLALWFISAVLSRIFASGLFASLFSLLALTCAALCFIRLFSRNLTKRRMENEKFLSLRAVAENELKLTEQKWTQRKEYKFFRCPSCHSALRVPKGKGKINIVCRRCGTSFFGKT